MHKISTTLAVMSLLAPVGASALGIGEIKLRSSLNQTFKAEIPLVTSGSESLDDIKVNIASTEAFGKAGIDRHFFLTKLRFTPTQKPDGSYVVQISSQEVVREPFLNFLVEVNWPSGRVLREFTVLLDPPSTFKEESVTASDLPTFARTPKHEPRANAEALAPRVPRASAPTSHTEVRLSGSEYGPVKRNETLGNIARQISQDMGVGQQQMLTALYQANPTAFYKNSVNALKAGETLKIPAKEYILSISPQTAKSQIYEQTPPREGKITERADASGRKPQQETETAPQGQLKLLAPDEGKSKLETAAIPGSKDEGGKTKSDIALEVADTVRQENEDIRSRLQGLEKQLTEMQRLLQFKDEQLAQMKSQGKLPEQPQTAIETQPLASPATAPVQQVPSTQETSRTPAPATAKEAVEQSGAKLPEPAAGVETSAPNTPAPKISAVTPRPAPLAPPIPEVEEPSLLSELLDNPTLPLAGAAGAVLLGLLTWLTIRRRTAISEATSESILAPSTQDRTHTSPAATATSLSDSASPTPVAVIPAKSSFLSEFTPSDFDALGDTDEVDPISEADVYLAYGRYKQAEELIRSAIDQYPDRDECKLKLLEIHYATENRQAFEDYAKQLFEQNKDNNPDFWDKVVEMGCELCPNNTLFKTVTSFSSSSSEHIYPTDELGDNTAINLDLDADFIADLKQFDKNQKQAQTPKFAAPSPFDFDSETIQDFNENAASIPDIEEGQAGDLASLEFDLSALNLPSASEKQEKANDLELDVENLIAFETSSGQKNASSRNPSADQTRPDKTLDDILIEMGAKPAPVSKAEEPNNTLTDTSSAPFSGADTEDELYASLTDMDEQETKLDLAKAYIDMGDAGTAKEIVEDVLQKGTDVQKKEARALLDKVEKLA